VVFSFRLGTGIQHVTAQTQYHKGMRTVKSPLTLLAWRMSYEECVRLLAVIPCA
jgi:hypothetical protein